MNGKRLTMTSANFRQKSGISKDTSVDDPKILGIEDKTVADYAAGAWLYVVGIALLDEVWE